jgi:RimJ/RimL family protein N-acetyltransferase
MNTVRRELVTALKASTGPHGPLLGLPVGRPIEAFLRPVATRKEYLNDDDVRALSEWRNRFVSSFLTEFEALEEQTARWLTDVIGPDDTRILFMVDDANGQTIGYMGLAFIDWENSLGEADAIVRGRAATAGLMKRALLTLLNWAHGQVGLNHLGVRVRSDNPAVEFYRKLGFEEVRRVPLRRIEQPNMIQWVEDESLEQGDVSLVHMLLPATALETNPATSKSA